MRLTAFQQQIVRRLETIPTGVSEFERVSLFEHGRIQAGQAVAGVLRSLRAGAPMNWDPWILPDGDGYRLFYLRGVAGHNPWWTFSKICAATSPDLQQWQDLGTVLEPEADHPWESGRICAGCTFKEDGTYYLFYSAGGQAAPYLKDEAIGLATSQDGIHWQRQTNGYPLHPDSRRHPWYGPCNWTGHFHWRDPYVFRDPQSERYYLFICASAATPGNFQGCIGLAVADRVAGPYEILSPVVAPAESTEDWAYYHLERPQVFYKNDRYHLLFSCFRIYTNPLWRQKQHPHRITNSSLYWYTAEQIMGPYYPTRDLIVPGSETTGMYGTNLLPVTPDLRELIAYGWYHRLHALEIAPTFRATWTDADLKIQLNHP